MNWKKWVGMLGIMGAVLALGPRHAQASVFQLATGSATITSVSVSSFAWTQVDTPQLAGRTGLEIQNVSVSSAVACNFNNTGSLTGLTTTYHLIPAAVSNTVFPDWSLSLSNFASNRGAYPVSVSLPVYCVTTNGSGSTTVIVTQTQ